MEEACKVFDIMTKSLEELCALEESSGLAQADRVNIAGTFKLVDIEGTIDHVDNVGLYFNRVHDTKIDTLRKTVVDAKNAAGAGNRFATLIAGLDGIVAQYQAWTELVNSAVCIVQLLNIEKRFGFFEQDCRHIRYQAEAWAGDTVENDPPSLRQMFMDPMSVGVLIEGSKKAKEHKKREIKAILADRRRLSKLAIQDTQAVNKSVSDQEPKLPSLPANVVYDGIRVPASIPQAVRQSIYDLAFTCEDIHQMRVELLRLRESVRCTMMIWVTASKQAWEYGVKHVHEFPDIRKYEYTRIALRVSYLIAFREEYKIFTYFLSEDRPKGLCPQFEANFVKFGRSLEKVREAWDDRVKKLTSAFIPVDDMLEQMGPINETLDEEMKKTDQWWNSLRPPSQT